MNQPSNRRGSNEELLTSEIGQVGTQFDGFAHQSIENSHYNCFKTEDIATRTGFTKLGIEKVGTLMTRGVLIDVAALKGVDMLGDTYEITVQDLQQALQRQNVSLQPGDAVIIHTGWGRLWGTDNARYMKSNRVSAWRRPSGWRSRTPCSSAATPRRSRSAPTPIRRSRCPSTRSCW